MGILISLFKSIQLMFENIVCIKQGYVIQKQNNNSSRLESKIFGCTIFFSVFPSVESSGTHS